jgi:hypothetical protein
LENLKETDHLEELNVGGRRRLDSSGSRQETVAGSYEYGNEPSGSIRGKEFDELSSYELKQFLN